MRVSVIIPTLNEEARIARQVAAVSQVRGIHEVIVVDGGSRDRTIEVAQACPGVRVISAPRGRGSQMNEGARIASGDVFLFLHADVELPLDAIRWVDAALKDSAVLAGAFRTWTVAEGRFHWAAPFLHLADLRSRYTSVPYGDQALFVRAEIFRALGGYSELPLMEDFEFSARLGRLCRIRRVPATVRVSGRRFLARPLHYVVLVKMLPLLYRLGVSPRVLATLYGNPR